MKPKKILLLSHLPYRDDVVDVMIKKALEDAGHVVFKVSALGQTRGEILLIQPDIVVFPEVRCESTRDMAELLTKWGVKVVQRRCEMGISKETPMSEELKACLYGNFPAKDYIDLDLVWGPRFADMLVENKVMEREKIAVVGGAGFDQYFIIPPPVKRAEEKTVMFLGGFGYADRNALYAIPEAKPNDKIHAESVGMDRNRRKNFIGLIAEFKKRFPQWKVLIRPHPGEFATEYKNRLGPETEFFINSSAVEAIEVADVFVHTGSTMAYEAHLKNKPSLNFRNTSLDEVVGAVSPTYDDAAGLLAAFAELKLGETNADAEVIKKLEQDYYGEVDGKAHKRIATAILSLEIKRQAVYPKEWPADELKYMTPGVMPFVEQWGCSQCQKMYFLLPGRETVKCPWCGIANIKVPAPEASQT